MERLRYYYLPSEESRTHQSAHCGKVDWKASPQVHLITSMNFPGLEMTFQSDMAALGVGKVRVRSEHIPK